MDLAVKARIPIINIVTEDVMFLDELFLDQLGFKPVKGKPSEVISTAQANQGVYYLSETSSANLADLVTTHKGLHKAGSTLILVNYPKDHPTIFNVGVVMPSKRYIKKLLIGALDDEELAASLMPALGGCGIKATNDFLTITMARDHAVSPDGVTTTRKQFFQGMKGLTQVDLTQPFYMPNKLLQGYVEKEKDFFLNATDKRLRPRGILMGGDPGVGKTEGAKWIARQMGVPLFRLDIASTKNKYVGESQRFLDVALATVSREAPCVLLFDEIEKVMSKSTNDSSGTSSDMLSQLLWWLAEHDKRVLTIMTTNNQAKIPPELIRDGRLDAKFDMPGLTMDEATVFAETMLGTLGVKVNEGSEGLLKDIVIESFKYLKPDAETVAHATVRSKVIAAVKAEFSAQQLNGDVNDE